MSKNHSTNPYNESHMTATKARKMTRVTARAELLALYADPDKAVVPDVRKLNATAYEAGQLVLPRCVCGRTDIPPLANGTRKQHTRKTKDGKRVHCPGSGTKLSVWSKLNRDARWDRAVGTGKSLGAELGIG